MNDDRLLTPQQAAARLNLPVSWVYARTRMDSMPGQVRLGRYVRILQSKLDEFIDQGGVHHEGIIKNIGELSREELNL